MFENNIDRRLRNCINFLLYQKIYLDSRYSITISTPEEVVMKETFALWFGAEPILKLVSFYGLDIWFRAFVLDSMGSLLYNRPIL